MDKIQLKNTAKQFEKFILPILKENTYTIDLSESGKAKVLMQGLINDNMCWPINFWCEHTKEEIEKCNCPFQTVESTLNYIKANNRNINEVQKTIPAEFSILPGALKQIEETLFEIEAKTGFGEKLLTFTFFSNDLEYTIKYEEIVNKLTDKTKVCLNDWLEKVKSDLNAEKWVIQNEKQQLKPATFKTNLNKTKLTNLFNQLIDIKNGFIAIETDLNNWLHVFGELIPVGWKFEQIEWIDKGTTRHEPNVQTLFELLYLMKKKFYIDKIYFDTKATNENNLYRIIQYCFKNLKNLPEKNPAEPRCDTDRKKLLNTIIENL